MKPARPRPSRRIQECIQIHGAREHNLKNINLAIPRNRFVVVTGVSGSGKSTLAFDLLFAEGQRRFLDSMNAYARQFVEQLARPEVDLIEGIPPTVSIEQRTTRGGGKSTVATVTELHQFIRLLFARIGTQYCPDCVKPVRPQTRDELLGHLRHELKRRGDLLLLAPVIRNRKGFHRDVAAWAARHGYTELRADGKFFPANADFQLDRFREHDVEIITGVLEKRTGRKKSPSAEDRELVESTLHIGRGTLYALDNSQTLTIHSTARVCPECGNSFEELDPKMFSYNSARGWCPDCRGFGELFYLPEVDRGARAEAIEESWFYWQEGEREACPHCQGARLKPASLAVHLDPATWGPGHSQSALPEIGPNIHHFSTLSVAAAQTYLHSVRLRGREAEIARDILPEIRERLRFLGEVGLDYLQLGRSVTTLSGGEAQRIRLAAQLGSNLNGVLYILDEPTIGLHARDNDRLLHTLQRLRNRGNSLVVVEHDEATMRAADHIVDLGPAAGEYGGEVVASGSLSAIRRHPQSVTGRCLRRKKSFPSRGSRRPVETDRNRTENPALVLAGARKHNLQNLTVAFPLHRFIVVTGVSGSGKSTLIRACLLPAVQTAIDKNSHPNPGNTGTVTGGNEIRAVYEVDQSPIGRTPRSTPATYVGVLDEIRRIFSQLPEARMRGYTPGRFSFNSRIGRCPECDGAGSIKLEMNFLPSAFVRCELCQGARYNPETLDIELNGRHIAQVLGMSVNEAADFFAPFPRVLPALRALQETGLGYVKLGQTSPTLSGGEAQRLKLVTHLLTGLRPAPNSPASLRSQKLFLLEEPTIGLHNADVHQLVEVLQRLVDAGHTVIVIEHNLELIAEADYVIDLGPEGGEHGGTIVATGTPESIAANPHSHTGNHLRKLLSTHRAALPNNT